MFAHNLLSVNHVIIVQLHMLLIALLASMELSILLVPLNASQHVILINIKTHGIIVVVVVILRVQPVMDLRIILAFHALDLMFFL